MHKIGLVYELHLSPKFTEIEGEIAGIFAGDGSQYFEPKAHHYEVNVHFGEKNYQYALYVKRIFENFFNKKFRLGKEKKTKYRLKTYSKPYFFFKNYLDYDSKIKHCSVKLKHLNFPLAFKIGFLRGSIDTDGYIKKDSNGNVQKIVFCTTSGNLADQITDILAEIGIKHGIYSSLRPNRTEKRVFYVNIWKESADKFIKVVRPKKAGLVGLVVKSGGV